MDLVQPQEEINNLREKITKLQHEYYVLGRPSVSDLEFDQLFDCLIGLEQQYPQFFSPDSPTHRVGSDISVDFPEVQHTIPVLSLDKAYTSTELITWVQKLKNQGAQQLVIEQKLDGASLVLYYEQGILTKAVTRGNGYSGNDITANVKTIKSVPLKLGQNLTGPVRGEVFLRKSDFDRLNQELETPYANPRNLASGSLRRVKSREVAQIPLVLYAYESFFPNQSQSHWHNLLSLKALGFETNPSVMLLDLTQSWQSQLEGFIQEQTQLRKSLEYEIDGLVLKVDDLTLRESLGYTGHHPRWALAYKFESPQGISRVIQIDVQIGRTGRATPVARIEPVQVGGSTISNVTLHNQDYINGLELSIGDQVQVSRRGDVIPAIESVVEKNPEGQPVWIMPRVCPSCGTGLQKQGAHHFCINFDCPDRQLGRLMFFTSRDQMDIEGLGSETVQVLWSQGWLKDIPDTYQLPYGKILDLPGFGQKKCDIIQKGVEASKHRPYKQVLASLGIPDLGPKVVELLITNGYPSIDDVFLLVDQGRGKELETIKGLGEKTITRIIQTFQDPKFRDLIERLKSMGLQFSQEPDDTNGTIGPFSGQSWCVTGTFEQFKPRDKAMEYVVSLGGQVVSDVSSKTTHLLAGEKAGSKLTKAEKLGVKIVSEREFLDFLDQHGIG
jgi:DNA ligase (NAD+)